MWRRHHPSISLLSFASPLATPHTHFTRRTIWSHHAFSASALIAGCWFVSIRDETAKPLPPNGDEMYSRKVTSVLCSASKLAFDSMQFNAPAIRPTIQLCFQRLAFLVQQLRRILVLCYLVRLIVHARRLGLETDFSAITDARRMEGINREKRQEKWSMQQRHPK